MKLEYRLVTDRIEDGWECGHRESRPEGGDWGVVARSEWVKNTRRYWFQKSPLERMADIGISTTIERASEFEQLVEDRPYDGWYYLGGVAAAMLVNGASDGEEGLKWIMGGLAAELNARKLAFSAVSEVMRAEALGAFATMLVTGKIDRTFAKPIFAELLKVQDWPRGKHTCPICDGHGYAEVEVGENPECRDCSGEGVLSLPVSFVEIISEIAADPRFKAADDSVIDEALDAIIAANPEQFEKAKENPKLIQWFVGQTMKATQGKAKAPTVIEKMQERINAA